MSDVGVTYLELNHVSYVFSAWRSNDAPRVLAATRLAPEGDGQSVPIQPGQVAI
jgi:hypothetical protein